MLNFRSPKLKPFSCSDGSAIGFFGSIFGLKSSHCFKTGGITGGFGLASTCVKSAFFFDGSFFRSILFRIIGLLDFRLAFNSADDLDTDADEALDLSAFSSSSVRLDILVFVILDFRLAAEYCRDLALFALGDCDRDGAVDLKLVSFSVCCLSRTCPGLKIFLSNFSFGQSVLHHQSKSLF